jgi:hypothetical protein
MRVIPSWIPRLKEAFHGLANCMMPSWLSVDLEIMTAFEFGLGLGSTISSLEGMPLPLWDEAAHPVAGWVHEFGAQCEPLRIY